MSELTFNLFLYGDELLIRELGVSVHIAEGTDEQKAANLRRIVLEDSKTATRYPLTEPIRWESYSASSRMGRSMVIFEKVFVDLNAPPNPLVVITPIVNEVPRIESIRTLEKTDHSEDNVNIRERTANNLDWLAKYSEGGGIDLPRLFDDDYFKAIKILFNAGHFVSSAKLLLSFIDTAAFLDLGDVPDNFVSWLNTYAGLHSIGITSTELWEYRNGLVHMTNISSRAVVKGTVAPLILFVGGPSGFSPPRAGAAKYFNYKSLLDVTAQAVKAWISTYNIEPNKFDQFVERYDLVVSDTRLVVATIEPQ